MYLHFFKRGSCTILLRRALMNAIAYISETDLIALLFGVSLNSRASELRPLIFKGRGNIRVATFIGGNFVQDLRDSPIKW